MASLQLRNSNATAPNTRSRSQQTNILNTAETKRSNARTHRKSKMKVSQATAMHSFKDPYPKYPISYVSLERYAMNTEPSPKHRGLYPKTPFLIPHTHMQGVRLSWSHGRREVVKFIIQPRAPRAHSSPWFPRSRTGSPWSRTPALVASRPRRR